MPSSPNPVCELLRIRNSRRQQDDVHMLGQHDDNLFPHHTTLNVSVRTHARGSSLPQRRSRSEPRRRSRIRRLGSSPRPCTAYFARSPLSSIVSSSSVECLRPLTIKQLPSALICTSPVKIPIEDGSKVVLKSRNFWFERALIGEV